MSLVGNEASKPRVILYFAVHSGDVAKDFAGRMRIADNVDVQLVWAKNFRDEQDVIGGIGAIVVQESVPQRDMIVACYNQWSPETEVHYMSDDGQWCEVEREPDAPVLGGLGAQQQEEQNDGPAAEESTGTADEGQDRPDQPAVQAEAGTAEADAADSAAEPDGVDTDAAGDADGESEEPAADSDASEPAREA